MKQRIKWCFCIFVFCVSMQVSFAQTVDPDFVRFWREFKSAVIRKDQDKLMSLTHFPFLSLSRLCYSKRSYNDEDDWDKFKINADEFQKCYSNIFYKSAVRAIIKQRCTRRKCKMQVFSYIYGGTTLNWEVLGIPDDTPLFVVTFDGVVEVFTFLFTKINGQYKFYAIRAFDG